MIKIRAYLLLLALLLSLTCASFPPKTARARADRPSPLYDSAYDLINAVNALRASYGLAPYSVNPILMGTAQAQADYMSSTGIVTHGGPGGSTVTQRLLAAGYPLAGDLSLGGFRSENIIAGNSMSAREAVNAWTGDAPHLNTMISPNLMEIGAGVSKSGGVVYYVIDCARPTSSGQPQASAPTPNGTQIVSQYISPVFTTTPDQQGLVIHEVKTGQTLWAIAIAYGVKIDDIRRLNNIQGNNIYPGMKLVVKKGPTPTPELPIPTASLSAPTPTNTKIVTATSIPSSTSTVIVITVTPIHGIDNTIGSVMLIAIAVIALALLAGGIFMWTNSRK